MRAGRPRIEQQRCECIAEMCEQPVILEAKIDIGKNAVTSRPTLGDSWGNSPQDFAALHLRRLFFLLLRFGMKRALGLRLAHLRGDCAEGAMIRDRNPGTDRNPYDQATHTRFHIQCWLWSARTRPRFKSPDMSGSPHSNSSSTAWTQTFSSASVIGAAPVAVTSGGTNSTLGGTTACD